MRVGILTFHRAENYGAVLQCFALQETLKRLNYQVEVLDYRSSKLTKDYKLYSTDYLDRNSWKSLLKSLVIQLLILPFRLKRKISFNRFVACNLNLSHWHGRNISNLPDNYDAFVIGSDQVWNLRYCVGVDDLYLGYIPFPKGQHRIISYAASMLKPPISDRYYKDFFRKVLNRFDAISVRETDKRDFLQPLTSQPIKVVLDPTLLLDKEQWDTISRSPSTSKKFVLVYQVRINSNALRIARSIAQSLNADVIEITSDIMFSYKKGNRVVSPSRFLGYFREASFIVTSSFHGTAFSVIYRKPFYSLRLHDSGDERSDNLLKQLGLESRMIALDTMPKIQFVDYSGIENRLQRLRSDSIAFLKEALAWKK